MSIFQDFILQMSGANQNVNFLRLYFANVRSTMRWRWRRAWVRASVPVKRFLSTMILIIICDDDFDQYL